MPDQQRAVDDQSRRCCNCPLVRGTNGIGVAKMGGAVAHIQLGCCVTAFARDDVDGATQVMVFLKGPQTAIIAGGAPWPSDLGRCFVALRAGGPGPRLTRAPRGACQTRPSPRLASKEHERSVSVGSGCTGAPVRCCSLFEHNALENTVMRTHTDSQGKGISVAALLGPETPGRLRGGDLSRELYVRSRAARCGPLVSTYGGYASGGAGYCIYSA